MKDAFELLKTRPTTPSVLIFPDFKDLVEVKIDASRVTFGAVSAQKKIDGKTHPIHYACHIMTVADQIFSACERETLAVIFALKKFCSYFLSFFSFHLTTDHQVLQYAFQEKEIHGLLTWLLDFFLSMSLPFDIDSEPGTVQQTF